MVRKSKKSRKKRGSRTHGYGAGKKHRGKGHRGGAGKSNVGKRGGSRKTKYLSKGISPYGKRGMPKSTKKRPLKAINISTVYEKIDKWVSQGKAKKTKKGYSVNLTKLGYDKLLGRGRVEGQLDITIGQMSKGASKKIKAED